MTKVVVIGTGYVGLVSGAGLAELGSTIVCVDKDPRKIQVLLDGGIPIYEPGLDELVKRNVDAKRLSFTTDLKSALVDAEAVLLAVGTPTDEKDGSADLSYVFAATREVASHLNNGVVLITKSTVPVGTGAKISKILKEERSDLEFDVVSNPEFLREGSAVLDFLKPDRIIIGSNTKHGKEIMQKLYYPLIGEGTPILFTNIPTAELIKYASNAFLATKIAFANEMSDICEGVGANIEQVIRGMGMDNRIGAKYMNPGPGFGGSCFPKDTLALTHIANDAARPTKIVESVIASNEHRKTLMLNKIKDAVGNQLNGKKIGVLGLTFKANTDDMRYSASLVIVPGLINEGAEVFAYDPEGEHEAKELLPDAVVYCQTPYEVAKDADLLVVITEWDEFKTIDLEQIRSSMKQNYVVDLRNIYDQDVMFELGFNYTCLGK